MGGIICTGAGCCFACCCQECAEGCRKWLGPERVTKIYYLLLVFVFVIPAIFVFFFLNQWQQFLQYFKEWISCPNSEQNFQCIGSSAVFRLSLCLVILFGLMMLIMVCRSRLAMVINQGCFCLKYLLVVGLFIGSLWISNDVFQNYSIAAQYISIPFMILQCIILIDLFYLAGIRMVKRYDDGENMYACYLITLTIIGFVVAIGMNVLGYIYFSSSDAGCASSLWVNIITSILLVVLPIIQFLHFNQQNSLLTTALVSVYISFLSFIGQFSFEGGSSPSQCVEMQLPALISDIIVSTFFFFLTMYGSIMGGTGNVKVTRNGNINAAMGVADTELQQPNQKAAYQQPAPKNDDDMDLKNEEKYTQTWDWVKWHFYMCLAAIYIGMLITNWNSADITTGNLQQSGFGFWVRIVLGWATFLLYTWTMIAPRVCPSRDFTVE